MPEDQNSGELLFRIRQVPLTERLNRCLEMINAMCRRTDKLSYATGIMAAAIIRPEIIHI